MNLIKFYQVKERNPVIHFVEFVELFTADDSTILSLIWDTNSVHVSLQNNLWAEIVEQNETTNFNRIHWITNFDCRVHFSIGPVLNLYFNLRNLRNKKNVGSKVTYARGDALRD